MRCRRVSILAFGLALSQAVSVATLQAEPRKLGLDDLTEGQQKELWQRTDDDAGYAALLKLCHRDSFFERRFVEAVQGCVDPSTIAKVVAFYRTRYASVLAHANPHPCDDPVFARNGIADKLKASLDNQVAQAKTLCDGYSRTGTGPRR